jgi:MoaA/NifB/PqqE/SkfB family radical SAM enzyme
VRLSQNQIVSLKVGLSTLYRASRLYATNGSMRAYLQAASHIYRKLTGQAPPVTAALALTFRCQCNCVHCFAAVKGRDIDHEMSTEELKDVINQLKALGSILAIFSGGEPLLREDIFDLVAHAHDIGLLTRISTNGFLLTRDCVAELKKAGLNQCGVSIDDADPATHDRLRGLPGCFERAVQGLRYLNEYNVNSKILVYAARRNVTEGLERIIDLGRRLHAFSVYILIPVATGRWAGSQSEVLSKEEMDRLLKLYDLKFVHLEFSTMETMCCAYDKLLIHIGATGDVTPCPYIPYAIGNIHKEPLIDIWRRHVSALRLEFRGGCPMNDEKAREALQIHTKSVLDPRHKQQKEA